MAKHVQDVGSLAKSLGVGCLFLLMVACGGENLPPHAMRPMPAKYLSLATLAEEIWIENGLKFAYECDRTKIALAIDNDEQFYRYTSYCAVGQCEEPSRKCEYGCMTGAFVRINEDPWPILLWSDATPVLHISERSLNIDLSVAHELVHWLEWCTGKGYDRHSDPAVWGPGGVNKQIRQAYMESIYYDQE